MQWLDVTLNIGVVDDHRFSNDFIVYSFDNKFAGDMHPP